MMWDAVGLILKPPGASKIVQVSSRKPSGQFRSPGAHPGSHLVTREVTLSSWDVTGPSRKPMGDGMAGEDHRWVKITGRTVTEPTDG